MNKDVLKNLSYGMYAVSMVCDNREVGCIANSIMQITQDTIALSINHVNYTNECLTKNKNFAVSILSEEVDNNTIAFLGFQSGRERNKFEHINTVKIEGLPIIESAVGYLICQIIDKLETETHTLFLARIINGDIINDSKPMTYDYYHKERKGKSPKTAPTFIE